MITKTPKFLYFLLILIALTAGDAWRRSRCQSDLTVNQAIIPLRKSIIDLNRQLSEIKTLLKKQQTVTRKLEQQFKKHNEPIVKQQKKTIDLIAPDENKTQIEKSVINDKSDMAIVKEDSKLNEFPDIAALAATNVTPKINSNKVADIIPEIQTVKKAKPKPKPKPKPKLPQLKRVTSLPAHTAVPEVVIPDKNPDLTSKTIDEKVEARTPSATSLSQTMLSGKKRGVRVTISDVLESYDKESEK